MLIVLEERYHKAKADNVKTLEAIDELGHDLRRTHSVDLQIVVLSSTYKRAKTVCN